MPLLPVWCTRVAGVSDQWVGYILTAQYSAVIVGQIVVGFAADRFGKRRVMLVVMAGDCVLFAASGFITRALPQLLVRAAVGLFAPPALAIGWISEVGHSASRLSARARCFRLPFRLAPLCARALLPTPAPPSRA